MNELAMFAGAGGGILGGKLLGWTTVCAVECDAYAASVLCARQNEGVLTPFPIWDDVRTFDGRPWRGRVDVVSGGFPCQDISSAGKGAGLDGERSGLWGEMARIIGEVRPRFAFVENSPMLTSRGLGSLLGDLAAMGYDARWGVLGAVDTGAPHRRDRIWIVADAESARQLRAQQLENYSRSKRERNSADDADQEGKVRVAHVADASGGRRSDNELCAGRDVPGIRGQELADAMRDRGEAGTPNPPRGQEGEPAKSFNEGRIAGTSWWATEPDVGRVAHELANRMDRYST